MQHEEHTLMESPATMIRVNHAGEYGATYIYKGQLAVLKRTLLAEDLAHMLAQEEEHLHLFSEQVLKRRVRPSFFSPMWRAGGYVLGMITALVGGKAAMACTVAVEDAIDAHYASQEEQLSCCAQEKELYALVKKCRADEQEHRDTGLAHGAQQAVGYEFLYKSIKKLSQVAIAVAKKI